MSLDHYFPTWTRSPFDLDVDPDKLRDAAAGMCRMAAEIERRGGSVRAVPGKIGNGWTGTAASATLTEVKALGKHLDRFVKRLDATRAAVRALAGVYAEAQETVRELNSRWDAAVDAHTAALGAAARRHDAGVDPGINPVFLRSMDPEYQRATARAGETCRAAHSKLQDSYDELLHELRRATNKCAGALRDEVPLPVDPDAVDVYRGLGAVVFKPQRPGFTANMPLSKERDRRWPPPPDVPEPEETDGMSVPDKATLLADFTGVAADGMEAALKKWGDKARAKERVQWDEYRAQGEAGTAEGRAARRRAVALAKEGDLLFREADALGSYSKKVPFVGYGLTGYTVVKDIHDGEDAGYAVGKAAAGTGAGAAAGAATVALGTGLAGLAYAGTAPVSVPITIGVLAIGASIWVGKAAEDAYVKRFGPSSKKKDK